MLVDKNTAVHRQILKECGLKAVQYRSLSLKIATRRWLLLVLLSSVLAGCAGNSGKTPVVDRSHGAKQRQANPVTSGQYIVQRGDRKSTRLNSSHVRISYAVFCLKKKKKT